MHAHVGLFSAVIAFAVVVAASPDKDWSLEARAGCNADNVLRALQAKRNSIDASNFCYSLLINQPREPSTSLVKAGVTPAPV